MRSRQDPLGLGDFDFDVKDFPFENLYRPDFIRFLWVLQSSSQPGNPEHMQNALGAIKNHQEALQPSSSTASNMFEIGDIYDFPIYIPPVSATKNRETFNIFQLLFRNSPSIEEIEQASDDFLKWWSLLQPARTRQSRPMPN